MPFSQSLTCNHGKSSNFSFFCVIDVNYITETASQEEFINFVVPATQMCHVPGRSSTSFLIMSTSVQELDFCVAGLVIQSNGWSVKKVVKNLHFTQDAHQMFVDLSCYSLYPPTVQNWNLFWRTLTLRRLPAVLRKIVVLLLHCHYCFIIITALLWVWMK